MRSLTKLAIAALATTAAATAATAQQKTFEDVESSVKAQVAEIERFQLLLQNPDARAQYAAVEQMLALEDPALQRIAKEHALFSSNPAIREVAIKAILDSGPTLRMQVATQGDATQTLEWLYRAGGSHDGTSGTVLVQVREPVAEDCWGKTNWCQFRHVGDSLQFSSAVPNMPVRGVLALESDGVLRGILNYQGERAIASIDLKE